jgi:hypothetical protein
MTDPTDPTDPTRPTDPTGGPRGSTGSTDSAGDSSDSTPTSPASPTIATGDDDRVAVLAAYLRTNRGRFTDEALAGAARAAGYSEAEIAAARSVADPTTDIGPAPARRVNHGVVAAVAIGYIVALYLLTAAASALSSDASGAVGLVGLLGGVIAWALLREERPSLAQGIGCGVVLAIAIPLVVILVILGICLVAGTGRLTG